MRTRIGLVAMSLSMALSLCSAEAHAQEVTPEESQNPLTKLRGLTFQNNFDFGRGEEERTGYMLLLQPWQTEIGAGALRLRSLAGLPLLYLPDPSRAEGGTFGLGDAEFSHFWSPWTSQSNRSGAGIGPIVRIPIATEPELGSGKWSAGVTLAAFARPRGWLVGFRTYNLWSFAGDEDRPDVNQFYFQYFVLRPLDGGWYVLSAPALTANWDAPTGSRWVVPVGGGAGKLFHFGRRSLDVHTAVYYNVVRPEAIPAPRWQLRVQLQYLFAK